MTALNAKIPPELANCVAKLRRTIVRDESSCNG